MVAKAYRSNSLNLEEQELFFSVLDDYEDVALFQLELTTGIRREDISNIEKGLVDLENKQLKFWENKKKRWHTVPLTDKTVQNLTMFIKTVPQNQKKLFNFSGRTAYNKLQRALKKAGIKKRLSFHDLRRTFIKSAKKHGLSVKAVAQIVGDTVATVQEHYENYSIEELQEELKKLGGVMQ